MKSTTNRITDRTISVKIRLRCRPGLSVAESIKKNIRKKSWIRKNRNILIPYGLNTRAPAKSSLTMDEKLRDMPVLAEVVPEISSDPEGIG